LSSFLKGNPDRRSLSFIELRVIKGRGNSPHFTNTSLCYCVVNEPPHVPVQSHLNPVLAPPYLITISLILYSHLRIHSLSGPSHQFCPLSPIHATSPISPLLHSNNIWTLPVSFSLCNFIQPTAVSSFCLNYPPKHPQPIFSHHVKDQENTTVQFCIFQSLRL
jgi:hypothetical protein